MRAGDLTESPQADCAGPGRVSSQKDILDGQSASSQLIWIVAVLACVAWIALSAHSEYRSYINVPFAEEWGQIGRPFSFAAVFEPHNYHRVVLSRLLGAVDAEFFRGAAVFTLAAIFLFQLGSCLVIAAMVLRAPDLSPSQKALLVSCGVFLSFWWYQYEVLGFGFQTCFTGSNFLVIAAFAIFVRWPHLWATVVLAILLVICATVSIASGIISALVLLALALFMRVPVSTLFVVGAACISLIVSYFADFNPPSNSGGVIAALQSPGTLVNSWLIYLGAPLRFLIAEAGGAVLASLLMGCVVALASAFVLLDLFNRRNRLQSIDFFAFALLMYFGLTAIAVALGRGTFDSSQALLASRYGTLIFPYYVGLLILGVRVERLGWRKLASGAAALLIVYAVALHYPMMQVVALWRMQKAEALTALVVGVSDREKLLQVHPRPDKIMRATSILRAARHAIFSEDWPLFVGQPLSEVIRGYVSSMSCIGHFDAASPIANGGRASGWVWDASSLKVLPLILLVADGSNVVGVGLSGFTRPDVPLALPNVGSETTGWFGHYRAQTDATLTAVALDPEARVVCPVSGQHHIKGLPPGA